MPSLRVHFLPELIAPQELAGRTCVVLDVLRATTTIVHALAAGARGVVPCASIEEAQCRAREFPADQVVLGGERRGLPIAGFLLGNTPSEYTPEKVAGKTIVLSTTNGTRTLLHCAVAAEVLVGAFVNLSALCQALAARESIDIVCAGTDRQISADDALLAGAIVDRLTRTVNHTLNDQARLAQLAWQRVDGTMPLVDALRQSHGGGNLLGIGLDADIVQAAALDRFAIVPRFLSEQALIVGQALRA